MAEEVKKQNISGSGEETGGRETDQKIDSQKPDAQGKNAEHSEKTFTQDEVNTIISKRLAEQQKKMPGKEEMEAFKKWQEGQKTAEQKQAEQAEARGKHIQKLLDEHEEAIKLSLEERKVIWYALRATLDGLKQLGANGDVSRAIQAMDAF